jgi:hypothetical protein
MVVVLCASPARAQEEPVLPGLGPIAQSANRIARELWPTDAPAFFVDESGRPRFRGGVTETLPAPPWKPDGDLSPVPVQGAISHREMVRLMTPMEFSTPLIGASVDPGDIYNSFKQAWRDWQARRIHERVEHEVEELNRVRAAADASK